MMGAFPGMPAPFGAFGGDRGAAAKAAPAAARGAEKGTPKGKDRERAARKNGQAATPTAAGAKKEGRRRAEKGRGDRKEEGRGRSDSNVSRSGLNLTAANFPPLPLVETPIPQAGYQGEFTQYTVDVRRKRLWPLKPLRRRPACVLTAICSFCWDVVCAGAAPNRAADNQG
jgi:hypothetical protein